MSKHISTSESPEQRVNVTALLAELDKLDTEQKIYNYLRTQFIDPADVDQLIADLSVKEGNQLIADLSVKEGKYKDLYFREVKSLKATLTDFKEYLLKYLQGTGKRIQKMEERNKTNAAELVEHVGETEVEKNLLKTRGRISQAMKFVKTPINGKRLKDVTNVKAGHEDKEAKHELSPEQTKLLLKDLQARFGDKENMDKHQRIEWAKVEAMLKEAKHELSPEQTRLLLKTLQARFEDKENIKRHQGIEWAKVEAKLKEASPEKLWSLNEMEINGHQPDVVNYDARAGEYEFFTCSPESPEKHRSIVYDKAAEEELKRVYPNESCNGNAVDIATAMGITLLSESEYRELQKKGDFDRNTWNWLQTPSEKRKNGIALSGDRDGADGFVDGVGPDSHRDDRGFRGSLRV